LKLRHAKRIDFTGTCPEFDYFEKFSEATLELIRNKEKAEVVIVIDRAFGFSPSHLKDDRAEAHIVSDHLNLMGDNPLVGPNDPIGDRFPVVNNIYLSAADTIDQEETWTMGNPLSKLRSGIVAGVKSGLTPSREDLELMHKMGAHFYNFNTVSTMIVAAHAGLKVLALAVPEGTVLPDQVLMAINR
jgi:purine-nucleoside phosphorylase